MEGIHRRYQAVLEILVKKQCSLSEAMRKFGIPRKTLRDFIDVCELRIIDSEIYKRVVEAEQQRTGEVSAKSIELRCRIALNEYRVEANRLKGKKKLLFTRTRTFTPKCKFSFSFNFIRFAGCILYQVSRRQLRE